MNSWSAQRLRLPWCCRVSDGGRPQLFLTVKPMAFRAGYRVCRGGSNDKVYSVKSRSLFIGGPAYTVWEYRPGTDAKVQVADFEMQASWMSNHYHMTQISPNTDVALLTALALVLNEHHRREE